MKKLFIVRHAKSSWDFPELDDFDRPLNKRGKANAPEMGRRLAEKDVLPDLLISSPAKRAAATARRIAEAIHYDKNKIIKEQEFYHGGVQNFVNIISQQEKDINTLMVFGHNPGLTDLANYLANAGIYNIPTCGIVEIDFDSDDWSDVAKGKGKLVSFDYPKKVSVQQT